MRYHALETLGFSGLGAKVGPSAIRQGPISRRTYQSSDKAPDFHIFASLAEIGAAWKKTSNEGRDHLSVKLDDPSLPAPILGNLFEMEGGEFELIWSRPNGNRSRE